MRMAIVPFTKSVENCLAFLKFFASCSAAIFKIIWRPFSAFNGFWYQFTTGKPLKSWWRTSIIMRMAVLPIIITVLANTVIIIEGQETAFNSFQYQFTTGKPLNNLKLALSGTMPLAVSCITATASLQQHYCNSITATALLQFASNGYMPNNGFQRSYITKILQRSVETCWAWLTYFSNCSIKIGFLFFFYYSQCKFLQNRIYQLLYAVFIDF